MGVVSVWRSTEVEAGRSGRERIVGSMENGFHKWNHLENLFQMKIRRPIIRSILSHIDGVRKARALLES
jgi:hypothetical protein